MKGFSAKSISRIKSFVKGGSVLVNVNNGVRHFFQTRKVLQQGDPLSSILVNIVTGMLAVLIKRAKDESQISGIVPHLVEDGISILQYADDTIIFMDHDLDKDQNMKLLLCTFEQVSGLKINFNKSELFYFGEAQDVANQYAKMFGFVSKYLGIPIHFRKLSNIDWKRVEEHFKKRLNGWKSKHLSIGGKLALINPVLSILPMYMMSFFAIP
jgi:hypothetical protein